MINCMNNTNFLLIKRALKYVKPYKFRFILAFICILSTTGLTLLQPILWGKILANLFEKNFYTGLKYIGLLSSLYIMQYATNFCETYLLLYLNENIILDIKKDLYKKILNLPMKAFDELKVGEFISRMQGDTSEIANIITTQLLNTIVDIIKVICIGVIVFAISIPLSFIVLSIFPLSYILFIKFGKIIRKKNNILAKNNDVYYGNMTESLTGIREIKGLGIKDYKFKSFANLLCDLKSKRVEITLINSFSIVLSNLLNLLSLISVMILGGYYICVGTLTIDYFIAFSSYSSNFSSSLMNITKLNSSIQKMFTSLERIFALMDNLNYSKETFGVIDQTVLKGDIKFENVSFEYIKGINVLNNITFHIENNKKVAIVGSSGSGKTTIFNLLTKFYDINFGEIFIDGININDLSERNLRKNIALVRQNPFVFNATIKENLRLVNENATDEDIYTACKAAYIHDYIESLPNGYNSIIGENGINLSGGQKQRIAIARALLKNSPIILFDEATSALDNESQHYIKEAIDELSKNRTIIIIAHRLSTIIDCDKIIVLEKSKIVGEGSHEFLIKNNSNYKKLYESELDILSPNIAI